MNIHEEMRMSRQTNQRLRRHQLPLPKCHHTLFYDWLTKFLYLHSPFPIPPHQIGSPRPPLGNREKTHQTIRYNELNKIGELGFDLVML